MTGWRRRALVAVAAAAGLTLVGSSIVIATIAGSPPKHAPTVSLGEAAKGDAPTAPTVAFVRRSLHGSPPRLAALHRQGGRLLGGDLAARLEQIRGYPVVLNAWASWCGPCREELPLMARAAARFGQRVAFVGADVDDSPSTAHRLLAGDHLSYPSYRVSAASVRELTPIVGFPTTIYLDGRGRVVFTHQGQYTSVGELAADVRQYGLRRGAG